MALTKVITLAQALAVSFVTAMALTKVPTFVRSIAVGFTTAMALAKTTQKTFSVGLSTGFGLTKITKPVAKAVSFVTGMAVTRSRVFIKAIAVSFVTAMSIATDFIAGVPGVGRVLWLIRRRRR